ncbi:DNA-binding transcriptional regulator, MarR family [Amycolatopsis xylanica]|uniref:DNA-binding transcriptional regulator, MarR family n=1 Tax=Amycolatopsis xylanica TaxID=589385 RepID=A0A1H2YUY1_9PSEU|nr:MarR family winged helix-turn-helix transcriptional regulator [Amycolatopsis xylanica]SDX08474.1 DNA-binding transcriptional regulator, MarR family [Amycolatopsis xylanica]
MPQRADVITELVNEIFAVNGGLLAAGDALTAPVGLTAAQWQVVGFLEDGPSTAAELARKRGLRRQSVQETVNRLIGSGMVVKLDNPADRRAPLLRLTPRARKALRELGPARVAWASELAPQIPRADLDTTLRVLKQLREALIP